MAVTTAQLGRHSRCVVFKQQTSGQSAGEDKLNASRSTNLAGGSFDGYYNFIGPDHV